MDVYATCTCGRELLAVEKFAQATRTEGPLYLGWWGWCPDCRVSVRAVDPVDEDAYQRFITGPRSKAQERMLEVLRGAK